MNLTTGMHLKITHAPHIISQTMIERLKTETDSHERKRTLFILQHHLKSPEFIKSFYDQGGLDALLDVNESVEGNALAYGLSSLQLLLSGGVHPGTRLSRDFLKRVSIFVKLNITDGGHH